MNTIDRLQLEDSARVLRELAHRIQHTAPGVSVRTAALATEIELRIKKLEALR